MADSLKLQMYLRTHIYRMYLLPDFDRFYDEVVDYSMQPGLRICRCTLCTHVYVMYLFFYPIMTDFNCRLLYATWST